MITPHLSSGKNHETRKNPQGWSTVFVKFYFFNQGFKESAMLFSVPFFTGIKYFTIIISKRTPPIKVSIMNETEPKGL